MNKIFIEAKSKATPECHFLQALMERHFPKKNIDFICINGIANLFKEANINQMYQALAEGDQVLILIDADTIAKGSGFAKRKAHIEKTLQSFGFSFPYFVYPNNQDEGTVENLMEAAARRDLHAHFFDCFEDYEKCVAGAKDRNGQQRYNIPNLKGKLHTYITAQKLSNKLRNSLGSGDWLFGNTDYWNLDAADLQSLKNFLAANLV